MTEETLHHWGTTLVRRMLLEPGEATRWHIDPFHRVSVALKGDTLAIEFRDGRPSIEVRVPPGQVDWDEPGAPYSSCNEHSAACHTRRSPCSSWHTPMMSRSQTLPNKGALID